MSQFFSESECVGQVPFQNGTAQVFATIDARFHADQHEVEVVCKAYLSPDDMEHIGEHVPADWLPERDLVKAACDETEVSEIARDIFHSWVRQVRASIPK